MFGKKKKEETTEEISEETTESLSEEAPKKSGGSSLKKAPHTLKRILTGSAVVAIGGAVLFYGGNFIAGETVTPISASNIDSSNNNSLVYAKGNLSSTSLQDPLFKVSTETSQLTRIVEYYEPTGDGETLEWKQHPKGESTEGKLLNSDNWQGTPIKLGELELTDTLISQLSTNDLSLTESHYQALSDNAKGAFKLYEGTFFFGIKPDSPKQGDMRVRYTATPTSEVAVLARQSGNTLTSYSGKDGNIATLTSPAQSQEQMVASAPIKGPLFNVWILRGIAGIIMLVGIAMIVGRKNNEPILEDDSDDEVAPEAEESEPSSSETEEAISEDDAFNTETPSESSSPTEDSGDPLDDDSEENSLDGFDLGDDFSGGDENTSPPSVELDSPTATGETSPIAPELTSELSIDENSEVEHTPSPEGAAIDPIEEISPVETLDETPSTPELTPEAPVEEAPSSAPEFTPETPAEEPVAEMPAPEAAPIEEPSAPEFTPEVPVEEPAAEVPAPEAPSSEELKASTFNDEVQDFPDNVEIIEPGSLNDVVVVKDEDETTPNPEPVEEPVAEVPVPEAAATEEPSVPEFTPEPAVEEPVAEAPAPEAAPAETPSVPEFIPEPPVEEPVAEAPAPEAATAEATSVPEFIPEAPVEEPAAEAPAPEVAPAETPNTPEFTPDAPTEPPIEETAAEDLGTAPENTPVTTPEFTPEPQIDIPETTSTEEITTAPENTPVAASFEVPEVDLSSSEAEALTDNNQGESTVPTFEMPTDTPTTTDGSLTDGLLAAQEEVAQEQSTAATVEEGESIPEFTPDPVVETPAPEGESNTDNAPAETSSSTGEEKFPWEEAEESGSEEPPIPQVKEF